MLLIVLIVLAVSAFTFIFLGGAWVLYKKKVRGGTSVVHRKVRGDEVRAEQIEIDSH